jgi:acyl-coenzyme A thioesterase PaaI-like protein
MPTWPTSWQTILFRFINFWPPFLGAGIRLKRVSRDFLQADVEMKLRWWNTNYVGVHFGGSLYAMTDTFFMLMAIELFRLEGWLEDYVIWDKAATVRFKRPGRGRVRAQFRMPLEQMQDLKRQADQNGKHQAVYRVNVVDDSGQVIAEVDKTLYIRKKSPKESPRN